VETRKDVTQLEILSPKIGLMALKKRKFDEAKRLRYYQASL
jgi:hypothetical protein